MRRRGPARTRWRSRRLRQDEPEHFLPPEVEGCDSIGAAAASAAPREEERQNRLLTRFLLVLLVELRELDLDASALTMLPAADATRAVPTIGAIAARTPRTCSASIPTSLAASRFSMYETGGASTATSAAMRTSISVSGSRFDAAIDSAVMLASRSRTGVSVVDSAMVLLSFDVHCLLRVSTRSRSDASSCRRTAEAGCRGGGSGTSPCQGRSGSSCAPSFRRLGPK